MRRNMLCFLICGGFTLSATLNMANGSIASDNAADPAYNSGLSDGQNAGSGLAAWLVRNSNSAGAFVGSSTGNGGAGNIDTAGRSWGLNAASAPNGNNGRTFAAREFSQGLLTPGQSFVIDIDMSAAASTNFQAIALAQHAPSSGPPYSVGATLVASSGEYFAGDTGSDWFTPNMRDTGIPTNQPVQALFTVNTGGTYTLNLNSLTSALTYTHTSSSQGVAFNTFYAEVDAIDSTTGPNGAMYFNSVSITPEPSALAFFSFPTLIGLKRWRFSRR